VRPINNLDEKTGKFASQKRRNFTRDQKNPPTEKGEKKVWWNPITI